MSHCYCSRGWLSKRTLEAWPEWKDSSEARVGFSAEQCLSQSHPCQERGIDNVETSASPGSLSVEITSTKTNH